LFSVLSSKAFRVALIIATGCTLVSAQASSSGPADASLAQSVQELREQVQELRSAVAEMKSEASEYRVESEELRKELEKLRNPGASSGSAPGTEPTAATNASTEQRLSTVEENAQVLTNEVRTQYQTKVESASKYRVRFSGLVVMNLFRNSGFVDNQDFPTYAASSSNYGERETFGATLRQSELGLEVFGPSIAGAKSSGQIQFDFGGGFPINAVSGVNTGIMRLRTADVRLDWANTSVIAGQDNLFISPNAPTSFASLAIPSLGYSGNLWAWTPQLRVEHRFNLSPDQTVSVQAGVLDNVTGEVSVPGNRLPLAGESTAQPAYAARTGWSRIINGRPLTFGASGYLSRQHWGPTWDATGWAMATDWRVPLFSRVEFSGELFRGLAIGGIGGGIGESVLFANGTSNLMNPGPRFRPLNAAGGWSQLKILATPKLEFNGAFGIDNPFSTDIHAVYQPESVYPQLLTSNRSEMMNFIFRPRSDLLVSGEYRHLRTSHIGAINSADQVNLVMGVLF
jgi:regulator of replication initiation timing